MLAPTPQAPQPAAHESAHSYRADRFLARVDAHIADLAPWQTRRFLTAQIAAWERAYARFICENEGDTDPPSDDPPSASDYLLTITGLAARLKDIA